MFNSKYSVHAIFLFVPFAGLYLGGSAPVKAESNAPVMERVTYEFQCETNKVYLTGTNGLGKKGVIVFDLQELRIGDQSGSSEDIAKINAELAKPDVVFMRPYVWCDAKNPMVSFGFQRISENRAVNHSIAAFFHGSTLDEIVTK